MQTCTAPLPYLLAMSCTMPINRSYSLLNGMLPLPSCPSVPTAADLTPIALLLAAPAGGCINPLRGDDAPNKKARPSLASHTKSSNATNKMGRGLRLRPRRQGPAIGGRVQGVALGSSTGDVLMLRSAESHPASTQTSTTNTCLRIRHVNMESPVRLTSGSCRPHLALLSQPPTGTACRPGMIPPDNSAPKSLRTAELAKRYRRVHSRPGARGSDDQKPALSTPGPVPA